jgi:hypothetical protein
MGRDRSRVVVASGVCDCHTIRSTHAHHRDYPEIQAEGESPAHAAARLINQLAAVLDTASDRWRREAVERAIADVKTFAEHEARDLQLREPHEATSCPAVPVTRSISPRSPRSPTLGTSSGEK